MEITNKDKSILRTLAEKKAEIAQMSEHGKCAQEWTRLNGLQECRPLVWINEIPWHEMNVETELTLQCENKFCREIEQELRQIIYQWKHMPGDMIVEPLFRSRVVINDTGLGLDEDIHIVQTDAKNPVVSREFRPQITCDADVEKIRMPEVTIDKDATERNHNLLDGIFGDILKVEKHGIGHQWFALWDTLVYWYGVQEALIDLILRPELVHACMERLLQVNLHRLHQYEELNLLSLDNGNFRIGSGGLGYTDELPQADYTPNKIRTNDQWGCANAQIFSEVSPEMHEEFALQYDRQWMGLFGMTYYGCCEPLHNKLDILSSIPNLRKISVSPWTDLDKTVELAGAEYVLSCKPNPAIFAGDNWHPDRARAELKEILTKTKGCAVEIIMKDISTVDYEPQRLWEWVGIASQMVTEYS